MAQRTNFTYPLNSGKLKILPQSYAQNEVVNLTDILDMQELTEIINHFIGDNKFNYPFVASSPKRPYKLCLNELLNDYLNKIETLHTSGEITDWLKCHTLQIKRIKDSLISALDEYLSGSAGRSYDKIETMMQDDFVQDNIVHLKVPLNTYYAQQNSSMSLYRIRCNDNHLSERSDIFHIPFEKRHLVKNQRFSIAGIPCLYLGTSLYVCWQEMGKPDFNKLYLSYFKINKGNNYGDINVLNLAYSLETLLPSNLEYFFIQEFQRHNRDKAKALLAFWPILMACSFNSEFQNAHFKVEYIIPNLILQWISKEKRPVSGVMYLSTKTEKLRNSDKGINLVFPPDTKIVDEGFCEKLQNVFSWSKPISWQLLDTIQYSGHSAFDKMPFWGNIEQGLIRNYNATKFYEMEKKLHDLAELGGLQGATTASTSQRERL